MGQLTTDAQKVMSVKHGDTRWVRWQIPNVDLTDTTVRMLVKRNGVVIELDAEPDETVTAHDVVKHKLTGTLPIGEYTLEFELTRSDEITTVPSDGYSKLRVVADLDE